MDEDDENISDAFMEIDDDQVNSIGDNDTSDLPSTLIVTNLDVKIFSNATVKSEFEQIFKDFDDTAEIKYLRSFRRALIFYSSSLHAARARIHLQETDFYGQLLRCYFAQPRSNSPDELHLQPPPLEKQFLISPPASPPVGWEHSMEAAPVMNYDLLQAISELAPGQTHEIHPPSGNKPAIIVHVCEDRVPVSADSGTKMKIEHTKCPERN